MKGRAPLTPLLLLLAAALTASCRPSEPPPHIFLVTSDTLRADHLSQSGYARATSPNLDGFAREALRFADAVTLIPKTAPAFVSLFSGRSPQYHGVRSNFVAIPRELPMLPRQLQALGYRTVAFVGNPVLREGIGFTEGFEHFETMDGRSGDGVTAVNRAFLEWSARAGWDHPTFVWLHYMDPHGPYTPPEALLDAFASDALAVADTRELPVAPTDPPSGNANKVCGAIPEYQVLGDERRVAAYVARYDAEIVHMDATFGELLAHLRQAGLYDGSALLFTSDHGESMGQDDFWFEHGWFANEGSLRIPLLLKAPGRGEGAVVESQVSLLDVAPTLLRLAGGTAVASHEGSDLLGPLADRPLLIENSDEYPQKFHGLRQAGWKYLRERSSGGERLFDLAHDPGEQHDLSAQHPERLMQMRQSTDELLSAVRQGAIPPRPPRDDDPEAVQRLRQIGYIGK